MGPKHDVESLVVRSAIPSVDLRSALLAVDGIKSDRVVHLVADAVAVDGGEIRSAEAWYTVRQLVGSSGRTAPVESSPRAPAASA